MATLLDVIPALLQRLVPLLHLILVVLLALLDSLQLLQLSLLVGLLVKVLGLCQLLLFLFDFFSLRDILRELGNVVVLELLILEISFFIDAARDLLHSPRLLLRHLVPQLSGSHHPLLVPHQAALNGFDLLHFVQLVEVLLCAARRRVRSLPHRGKVLSGALVVHSL